MTNSHNACSSEAHQMLILWLPLLPIYCLYCLTQAARWITTRRQSEAMREAAWHNAIQAEQHH